MTDGLLTGRAVRQVLVEQFMHMHGGVMDCTNGKRLPALVGAQLQVLAWLADLGGIINDDYDEQHADDCPARESP